MILDRFVALRGVIIFRCFHFEIHPSAAITVRDYSSASNVRPVLFYHPFLFPSLSRSFLLIFISVPPSEYGVHRIPWIIYSVKCLQSNAAVVLSRLSNFIAKSELSFDQFGNLQEGLEKFPNIFHELQQWSEFCQ